MKKALATILLITTLLLSLCSCGAMFRSVKCVSMNLMSCQTFYLYEFENADIGGGYQALTSNPEEKPTSSGYVYSNKKLKVGDTVEVWTNFEFNDKKDEKGYISGTEAVVTDIVEKYEIKVTGSINTYIITYYTFEDYTSIIGHTFTDLDDVFVAEKHKVKVSKEIVIIEYYV